MNLPAPASSSHQLLSCTYPGTADQVRRVRRDLRLLLDGCPIADDVILCASELAANATQHSNSREPGHCITVRCDVSPGSHVCIQVDDDGGRWIEPPPDPSRGRGLDIIRALAAEWAITTTPTGRTVSARLNWQPRRALDASLDCG